MKAANVNKRRRSIVTSTVFHILKIDFSANWPSTLNRNKATFNRKHLLGKNELYLNTKTGMSGSMIIKISMMKKLTTVDFIMLIAAFLSLIFSETLWFTGDKQGAIFIGLWVPSILGFAIYLKLLKN